MVRKSLNAEGVAVVNNRDVQTYQKFHNKMLWTRFATVVLGLWLLASPATFAYSQSALIKVI